jgi:thiamine kinase-like enzyme
MGSILDGATQRRRFAGDGGRTGAKFETALLADRTPVVIKHASYDDWVIQASGGRSALFELWEAGAFDRVPDVIEHAMLAVEPAANGFVVVMKDVSEHVLAEGRVISRDENRRIMAAADRLHQEFRQQDVPGLSLYQHYDVFALKRVDEFMHLDTPIPPLVKRGWQLFVDLAPSDVWGALEALLHDPQPLVDRLGEHDTTLIHGDLRLHNLGLSDDKVVLLDWEVAGRAPPAVEFAWYLIISASRIDATREQVIGDYRAIAGDRYDDVAWDLGCIGAMIWLGWNKAIDIIENPDPKIREAERSDLDWWIARTREALEVWSPV